LRRYEIERKKRIAENKRKFEEHLKDLQKKKKTYDIHFEVVYIIIPHL